MCDEQNAKQSRKILVVGRGNPYHVTEDEAAKLVRKCEAIWQKPGRRIKYIKGKWSHPHLQVRDLTCTVDEGVVAVLLDSKNEAPELHKKFTRDFARVFVNQTRRKRERVRHRSSYESI